MSEIEKTIEELKYDKKVIDMKFFDLFNYINTLVSLNEEICSLMKNEGKIKTFGKKMEIDLKKCKIENSSKKDLSVLYLKKRRYKKIGVMRWIIEELTKSVKKIESKVEKLIEINHDLFDLSDFEMDISSLKYDAAVMLKTETIESDFETILENTLDVMFKNIIEEFERRIKLLREEMK